jgi:hypothetical protein
MPYLTYDPENGRYFHISLGSALPGYWDRLESRRDSLPADEPADALAAALAITSRLPAGGPPMPWPFVRRHRDLRGLSRDEFIEACEEDAW